MKNQMLEKVIHKNTCIVIVSCLLVGAPAEKVEQNGHTREWLGLSPATLLIFLKDSTKMVSSLRLPDGNCLRQSTGVASPAQPRVRTAGLSLHAKQGVVHPEKFRAASLNVGTLTGKSNEVVETLSRRGIDLCCVQETRLKCDTGDNQTRVITGKDTKYKLYFCGNNRGLGGVGILLAEKWLNNVFKVERFSDRIMLLKLVIGKVVLSFLSLYAPQVGLPLADKIKFYDQLQAICTTIPCTDVLFCIGDWNGHVGAAACGYENVHGGHGYGERNTEGERILEFATANDLLVGNTRFIKRETHLITYQSGDLSTQVDYVLYRKSFRKEVTNVKVIPGEECASQHRLLVCDLRVQLSPQKERKFTPRLRTWKLRDPATACRFQEAFRVKIASAAECRETPAVETAWSNLKTPLLEAATEVCGLTSNHRWKKVTWWWNDRVDKAIKKKRACFKTHNALRKQGNSPEAIDAKAEYNKAKRAAKREVWLARSEAEAETFKNLDPQGNDIYRLARQMDRTNQDIVGEKCVRNDAGELALTDADKMKAWVEHLSRLLNVEFDWPRGSLPEVAPTVGPPPPVTADKILAALRKMKPGKAAGPSGITAEMLKSTGPEGVELIRQLGELVLGGDAIPKEWEERFILNLYKGKSNALDRGN